MGLIQYSRAFADDFDSNSVEDVLNFERLCGAQDAEIFRSAFAPGADQPRRQMPPRVAQDFAPSDALDDQDIADSAFEDQRPNPFGR